MLNLVADILMVAGAIGAGVYCLILSRRLSRFTDLEGGMGGAVAVLSVQVDDLKKALEEARKASNGSVSRLTDMTKRAEESAARLEILLASMHDLPESEPKPGAKPTVTRRRRAACPEEQEAA
ncbi:hypothetical protein KUV47_14780 [Vannielia litorea]|uniref:hypothetical protein n=1 Tax=Vannielia litorea TaxID=1217970 RepID=UPI001C93C0F5|nr:hypothetical protein [Vannielia litorea]MBY6154486.1 hypothetical protein [Vannielia litorea]